MDTTRKQTIEIIEWYLRDGQEDKDFQIFQKYLNSLKLLIQEEESEGNDINNKIKQKEVRVEKKN